MEQLFSEEVIKQFFEVLTTAAELGGAAFILWLCIPIALSLITALAWVYGIVKVVAMIKDGLIVWLTEEPKPKKVAYTNLGSPIMRDAMGELERLLLEVKDASDDHLNYIHDSHVRELRMVWQNRPRTTAE